MTHVRPSCFDNFVVIFFSMKEICTDVASDIPCCEVLANQIPGIESAAKIPRVKDSKIDLRIDLFHRHPFSATTSSKSVFVLTLLGGRGGSNHPSNERDRSVGDLNRASASWIFPPQVFYNNRTANTKDGALLASRTHFRSDSLAGRLLLLANKFCVFSSGSTNCKSTNPTQRP